MFEKILSTLPYNPSLVHQMAFYGKRMREERSIRSLGVLFVVLAFVVQFVAVLAPPQSSVADSSNDLVNGGIKSAAQASTDCLNNVRNYRDILNYYGISCGDVGSAPTISLKSTDYNKQLYSAGYIPRKIAGETPANIPGVQTIYWRYLWSWDTYAYSTYSALQVKSSITGKTYFILYNCGNLVSVGIPSPPPAPKPAPAPTPSPPPTTTIIITDVCPNIPGIQTTTSQCKPCTAALSSQDTIACVAESKAAANLTQNIPDANNTTAHAGDTIRYTLYAKNTGKASVTKFVMQENLSDVLDYADVVSLDGGSMDSNDIVSWPAATIAAGTILNHQITVKVKSPIPATPTSSSDPGHFDLIMTNVYGNAININLPPVNIVQASQKLPNTGPGTSITIVSFIVLITGYFAARARLLSREAAIAIQETTAGGL